MKHKFFGFLAILVILLGLQNNVKTIANEWTVDRVENLVDGLIAYNEKESGALDDQSWIDDIMASAPESYEWYAFGLSRYKQRLNYDSYSKNLTDYLNSNTVKSPASGYKYALILVSAGDSENPIITKTAEKASTEQGIMSLVYELHLLNNINFDKVNKTDIIDRLLEMQLSDGGFAVNGEHGDVDVTAMTVQALSAFYTSNAAVKTCVDKALDFLSVRQEPTGDFKSYGQCNPESCSQVLVALCSLGINPGTDERFIKNGNTVMDGIERYKLENDSYSHILGGTYNRNATIQAFYSYIALWRFYSGKSPLYILTDDTPISDDNVTEVENTTDINKFSDVENTNIVPSPSVTHSSELIKENSSAPKGLSIKYAAVSVIVLIAAFIMILLTVFKKRNIKNYVFTGAVAAIAVLIVLMLNIQSREEYYSDTNLRGDISGKVTFEIRCDSIKDKYHGESDFNPVIIAETEYGFYEGDSCYDILVKACKDNKITIDSKGSAGMIYVSGINLLYEFDYGDLSGWMYFVNGEELSVSCDSCKVKNGDKIQFLYTCELGKDLEH